MLGRDNQTHQRDSAQMGTCLQSVGAGGRVLSSYGWTSPFFSPEQVKQLVNVICETEPVEHGLPGHGWTLKKLRRWLKQVMGCDLARSTLHRIRKQRGCAGKSARRCSRKPTHRNVPPLWHASTNCMNNSVARRFVWSGIDEAHIHRDMDLGYTWAEKNKIAWRMSDCAPLSDRINWYGAYDFCANSVSSGTRATATKTIRFSSCSAWLNGWMMSRAQL